MPYDTVDRASVGEMIRHFYSKILKDATVGPFFMNALGSDMKSYKWYEHLKVLENFWLLMVNGQEGYKGHPFPPHAFIGQLHVETFERWLEIFHETVHQFYVPEIADKFYEIAEGLAQQFMENLDVGADDEDDC